MILALSTEDRVQRLLAERRTNFIADYDLAARPALVWQCAPLEPLEIDVADGKVQAVVQRGVSSTDSWWQGFNSSHRSVLTFDGLASGGEAASRGWTTELHADGHFIAGLWRFPGRPDTLSGQPVEGAGVPEFYGDAFIDFATLVLTIFEAVGQQPQLAVSCTMLKAPQLPLINQRKILAPPPRRETLHWPVRTATTPAELNDVLTTMRKQFFRAYGRLPSQED